MPKRQPSHSTPPENALPDKLTPQEIKSLRQDAEDAYQTMKKRFLELRDETPPIEQPDQET